MKLSERFYPSLLVSESFYPLLKEEDKLYQAVESVLREGYYQRIETGVLKTARAREKFIALVKELGIGFTQWITTDINELHLNPSATDKKLRKKTIDNICTLVEVAAESGADRVAMVSGPDPGEKLREEAQKGIEEVLFAVTEKMLEYPGMQLLLEPLDRGAHKNNFIGPTSVAVELMKKVNEVHENCRLSWDSAHMALNKENLKESLRLAGPYIGHIHLANAVLNPAQEGYGDWHMPMGKPGFLDIDCGRKILCDAASFLRDGSYMGVSIESRCQDGQNPYENESVCREFLCQVLNGHI